MIQFSGHEKTLEIPRFCFVLFQSCFCFPISSVRFKPVTHNSHFWSRGLGSKPFTVPQGCSWQLQCPGYYGAHGSYDLVVQNRYIAENTAKCLIATIASAPKEKSVG